MKKGIRTMVSIVLCAVILLFGSLSAGNQGLAGLVTLQAAAQSAGSGKCGANIEYVTDYSTGVMLLRGSGEMWNTILDGYGIKTLIVEEGITGIGSHAFSTMYELTAVSLPQSLTSIGAYAFYNCVSLKSIKIPDSVTTLGDNAFWGCSALTSVTLGNGITKIDHEVFYGCKNLQSICIPDSVKSIEYMAFKKCASLQWIHIPSSVTAISTGDVLANTPAYICSNSASSTAKNYADWAGMSFRICSGHDNTHAHACTGYVTESATCTKSGKQVKICGICGNAYSETIAKTAHTLKTEVIAATCTQAGRQYQVCTVCMQTVGSQTILPELGHDYRSSVTKQATCTQEGVRTYTCTRCGNQYTQTIEKVAHSAKTVTVAFTCVEEGKQYQECSVCGTLLGDVQMLPKKAHSAKTVTIASTCMEEGKQYQECSVCGTLLGDVQMLPKSNHIFGSWMVVRQPTTTSTGLTERKCTVCKTTETQTIPALEPVEVQIDAPTAATYKTAFRVSATVDDLPANAVIRWTCETGKVQLTPASDGKQCTVQAKTTGSVVISATVFNANGQELGEAQASVTVKYTWWQNLIRIFLLGFIWY